MLFPAFVFTVSLASAYLGFYEPPCAHLCAKSIPLPDMTKWNTKQVNITSIFARNMIACTSACDQHYPSMFKKEDKLLNLLKNVSYEAFN